ncbi:unnamed protein product [Pedinophyceae sp. YPF-701]|nr:unnamed protein product [Pedinophyceae sp. YPF-701]
MTPAPAFSVVVRSENINKPWWTTFCGSAVGHWQGSYAAFSPMSGQPELLGYGPDREKQFEIETRVLEVRQVSGDGATDRLARAVFRGGDAAALRDSADAAATHFTRNPDSLPEPGSADAPAHLDDVATINAAADGLLVFEDGSYSNGPYDLLAGLEEARGGEAGGAEPGEGAGGEGAGGEEATSDRDAMARLQEWDVEPEPTCVVVVEQCVCRGAKDRVRVVLTLEAGRESGGEELSVMPLRLTAHREVWAGGPSAKHKSDVLEVPKVLSAPRMTTKDIEGEWAVFEQQGVPVDDPLASINPYATDNEKIWAFSTCETRQTWGVGAAGGFDISEDDDEVDGAMLWLPSRILVVLRMVPDVPMWTEDGSEPRAPEEGAPRGLQVCMMWLSDTGEVAQVRREYDSRGVLKCVTASSAVKGWVGGRM